MQLKFSQDIEVLLKRLAEHPLTLEEILKETSERGFSLVIGLLVLPFLIPVPLVGISSLLGLGCVFLGMQMCLGFRSPWLPKRVARLQFPRTFILKLLKNLQRINCWLEKVSRPRLGGVARNPHVKRWNGFCIAWLGLLLMLPLPIPFTNTIPTIGILLLVVATLEGDGLLMCLSYSLVALITVGFSVPIYAILNGVNWLEYFSN